MAKKKPSQISQEQRREEGAEAAAMETQMEEKVANLKSLNALLVRETFERREQIDALAKENERMAAEAARALGEKQSLEGEKRGAEEEMAKAELERSVAMAFVAEEVERLRDRVRREGRDREGVEKVMESMRGEIEGLRANVAALERSNADAEGRVRIIGEEKLRVERGFEGLKGEMEGVVRERRERDFRIGELEKAVGVLNVDLDRERKAFESVSCERDEIRKRVDGLVEELRGLQARVHEQEQRNVVVEEELGRLQAEKQVLIEGRKERERVIESLGVEKKLFERKLVESMRTIEDLRRDIIEVEMEKGYIEAEKAKQVVGIGELQKEVVQLRTTISGLKEEEKGLRSEVYELGKSNAEALEKQEQLRLDFGKLVEEKRETEGNLKLLMDEKDSIMRSLDEMLMRLEDQMRREDGIVREKAEIECKSAEQEVELVDLRKEIGRLRDSISALEVSCKNHVETNEELQCEAKLYQDKLENLTVERDATRKELDSKRNEESTLRLRVVELEKSVEERERALAKLRKEHSNLFEEKKGTKSRIETLMEEKRSLERSLSETEEDFKNLGSKMKSYKLYSEKVSELLGDITKVLCTSEDVVEDGKVASVVNADNIEKELNLVAAELDTIKKSFSSKDEKVEEMRKELEVMKKSLKEAHQKKSFWTLVSSASTIVAAASLAYVSRVR